MKEIFDFNVKVHTLQMVSNIQTLDLDEANRKHYKVGNKRIRQSDNKIYFPLNPSKFIGHEITNLTELYFAVEVMREDLGVSEWLFNRVDIAFDIAESFDRLYPFLVYFFGLSCAAANIKHGLRNTELDNLKNTALSVKGHNLEIQFYDKCYQSGGKYQFTRLEFRFRGLNTDNLYPTLERCKRLIGNIIHYVGFLNSERINSLKMQWKKDLNNGNIHTFAEFVRKYNFYIPNRTVLKVIYTDCFCGKNFDFWLKYYRKKTELNFISQNQLNTICKKMCAALDIYAQN